VNALNDVASPVARPNSPADTTSEQPALQSGTSGGAQMGLTEKLRRDAASLRNSLIDRPVAGTAFA